MLAKIGDFLYIKKYPVYLYDLKKFIPIQVIINDILNKNIIFSDLDDDEIKLFIENDDIWMFEVENIKEYIAYYNQKIKSNDFILVNERLGQISTKLDALTGIMTKTLSMINRILDKVGEPSEISLKAVHQELFPEYNINSLRNILTKNKYKDGEYWVSHLRIQNFNLTFRKLEHTKEWRAFRVDYEPEKQKTFWYDFNRKKRSKYEKKRKNSYFRSKNSGGQK